MTCGRCGAPLTDAGHPSGAFTGRDGAELRVDSRGVTVRRRRNAPARLLSWEEISWFRDCPALEAGWVLQIVLASGGTRARLEIWISGSAQASEELLALIRRAAAAHSIPAVLTGSPVLFLADGPDETPGLYHDPAGQPGLREWTGTEWSPFLQADPVASGHPGQGTGLARIWSPLPAAVLRRQSRAILLDIRVLTACVVLVPGGGGLLLILGAVHEVMRHVDGSKAFAAAAFLGIFGVLLLTIPIRVVRQLRPRKKIALALRTAATRPLAQDDPPASAVLDAE